MAQTSFILAGFGGQGLLFAGKIIAQAGLQEGREVSWLPSYGPEMRGGTCNCSVCVSDTPIGSPLVTDPDVVIAMNQPSVAKFMGTIKPGGLLIVDSTLVEEVDGRDDITIYRLPATHLAEENGFPKLANVILTGKAFRETGFCKRESIDDALRAVIPARKKNLLEPNQKALALGIEL